MKKIPCYEDSVAFRIIDGQAVILTPQDGVLHTFNEVGTRIWELSNGEKTIEEIANALTCEFNIDEKEARADIEEFIENLIKKGLIVLK